MPNDPHLIRRVNRGLTNQPTGGMQMSEHVTGIVERVNATGFKLADGEWLNVSKFARNVEIPRIGATVEATLDSQGFVRKLAVQDAPRPTPNGANGHHADRERSITRLAVLNTATAILGGGAGFAIDAADVVTLATRLEDWVARPS